MVGEPGGRSFPLSQVLALKPFFASFQAPAFASKEWKGEREETMQACRTIGGLQGMGLPLGRTHYH